MGVPKSVDARVSMTLERLERLMGGLPDTDTNTGGDHPTPETVEEAVRRLKGKLPQTTLRQMGE